MPARIYAAGDFIHFPALELVPPKGRGEKLERGGGFSGDIEFKRCCRFFLARGRFFHWYFYWSLRERKNREK